MFRFLVLLFVLCPGQDVPSSEKSLFIPISANVKDSELEAKRELAGRIAIAVVWGNGQYPHRKVGPEPANIAKYSHDIVEEIYKQYPSPNQEKK